MLKRIKQGLNKRKVKVFLLFLIGSFLAWSISKFSESYESRVTFKFKYKQFPDSLLLNDKATDFFKAKLRANGFQFLNYGINQNEIQIDLKQVNFNSKSYFLTSNAIKTQLERQLPKNVSLLELERDTFFIDLYTVAHKEVPVKHNITIDLAPNHLLEGELQFEPAVVIVKGPSDIITQIDGIYTEELILESLTSDFSKKLKLIQPETFQNVQLLTSNVTLSGKVVEFSEKEFDVAISAINLTKGVAVKMFPNTVKLICKASVANLKKMESSDFEVVVDYSVLTNSDVKYLDIQLRKQPKDAYSVTLLSNQVEFVLEKL